jgi:hypothetical protein
MPRILRAEAWLQPGDACALASADVAAQFQRFLQPAGFFDFHPDLFNTDADGPTRYLCIKQWGDSFDTLSDLIDHCYPGPGATTIATCRLRFHPPCSSSVQFGVTCHYAHDSNLHVLWHFLNGHIGFCYCGMPFDCCVRLASHQRECRARLQETEAGSLLTSILGVSTIVGFNMDI